MWVFYYLCLLQNCNFWTRLEYCKDCKISASSKGKNSHICPDHITGFEGHKEDKWSVCAFMGKQPPAIRALCMEKQSSSPKRTLSLTFSSFLNFCQDKNYFGSLRVIEYRCRPPCFLPFLAHLLLNFLFPWLVADFSLLTASGNEVERLKIVALPTGICQHINIWHLTSAVVLN